MKQYAIVWLPNGNELQFSTVDMNTVEVVKAIRFSTDPASISIVDSEDSVHTYVGIPFSVEVWK
jgi:hypothetical protein